MIDCCWVSVYGFLFRTLNIAKLKKNIEKHGRGDIKNILLDVFFIYLDYFFGCLSCMNKKKRDIQKKKEKTLAVNYYFCIFATTNI